jgi:RNA polymerase sigma-70 factor (ECF subfamily)
VEALYPLVIRIVRRHRAREMDEADLAQMVFVRVFRSLESYDARAPLEHWVARISVRVCLNALRSRRRRPELRWADLTEAEQAVVEQLASAGQPTEPPFREAKELLARLMESLPADDRLVLTLLHLDERSVAEVAELTGWNRAVVKMRAFRARRRLRKQLEALERESG